PQRGLRRRVRLFEADPRGQAFGLEAPRDVREERERLLALAALEQDPRQRERSVRPARLELESAPQRLLLARGHERVRLRGDQRVEERLDRRSGLNPDELADDARVAEG